MEHVQHRESLDRERARSAFLTERVLLHQLGIKFMAYDGLPVDLSEITINVHLNLQIISNEELNRAGTGWARTNDLVIKDKTEKALRNNPQATAGKSDEDIDLEIQVACKNTRNRLIASQTTQTGQEVLAEEREILDKLFGKHAQLPKKFQNR